MTNKNLKGILLSGVAFSLMAPASVFATNGMFLIGTGTKARGMGGVGITMTHDVFASVANPATMVHVGNRFDIGGDIFMANAEATMGQAPNNYTVESKPDHFALSDGVYMMPGLGASWNDGDLSYGFTMVSVGGGGSRYDFNIFNCANSTPTDCNDKLGVSLLVMNINPTIAYKLDDDNSIGASLMMGVQVFKSYGLQKFTPFTLTQDDTAKFTNEHSDIAYGAGLRLGWLGEFMDDKLKLGVSYTSKTYMKEFDKYTDLFAEQGDMDTPGNIGIGASYQYSDKLTLAIDINYIMYEDVAAVSNPGPDPRSTTGPFPVDRDTNALGADEGLGFGWDNQTVFKVGAFYQYNPSWVLRAGWNYAKSPIDENFDILFSTVAPAVVQHHLTLGATYQYAEDIELSFSYVHAFEFEQYGPTYINYEGGYKMSQDSIGASFAMKF